MPVDSSSINTVSPSSIDEQFLSLFPSLTIKKPSDLAILNCLGAFGDNPRPLTVSEISEISKITPSSTKKMLQTLVTLSLLREERRGKKSAYCLTSKGIVALMSIASFQSFSQIKPLLTSQQNDDLAFALLVIGHSPTSFLPSDLSSAGILNGTNIGGDSLLYITLSGYAKYGHNMETLSSSLAADSILRYFSMLVRGNSKAVPHYLNMFRDFTPAGFQDILKMLVVAVKPTPEDYNWLIQFFHELVEFYYNPIRLTYTNMLNSGNQVLRDRLDNYRKEQEVMMKSEGSSIELTFKIVGGFELDKFVNMPPHLKAMALKLVLEPLRFMNDELRFAFWSDRQTA